VGKITRIYAIFTMILLLYASLNYLIREPEKKRRSEHNLQTYWVKNGSYYPYDAAIWDVNHDGKWEIFVNYGHPPICGGSCLMHNNDGKCGLSTEYWYHLICMDERGNITWDFPSNGLLSFIIVDTNDDGIDEIVCFNRYNPRGEITILDPINGQPIDTEELNMVIDKMCGCINGKDKMVYVLGGYFIDYNHTCRIMLYDPKKRQVQWICDFNNTYLRGHAVGDLNNDGFQDIIISMHQTDNNRLICIDGAQGKVLWSWDKAPSKIILADIDGNGELEVLGLRECSGKVYIDCLDHNGRLLWSIPTIKAGSYRHVAVSDVDMDGALEIVVKSGGNLCCIDSEGNPTWTTTIYEDIYGFIIADINGDGMLEIITIYGYCNCTMMCDSTKILCIDAKSGNMVWAIDVYNASPITGCRCGDIDGDGKLELIFGTTNYLWEEGYRLRCLKAPKSRIVIAWGCNYLRTNNHADLDSDFDGIKDYKELDIGTNPYDVDTDNDMFSDNIEIMLHTDPNNPYLNPFDLYVIPPLLVIVIIYVFMWKKKTMRKMAR